ncbi:hypothetical protein [Helicobacter mehlei]|uniref:Uncharacterized protein n=1 Tax=Helicobacter mehlei TaxID=2316080 RepID=A0A553UJF6_9HELI|nr:hypothetical protein [Helicobacter mehlei]TSA80343.1 hypothetical protein FNE76_07440 [Helicobacter mehlei]
MQELTGKTITYQRKQAHLRTSQNALLLESLYLALEAFSTENLYIRAFLQTQSYWQDLRRAMQLEIKPGLLEATIVRSVVIYPEYAEELLEGLPLEEFDTPHRLILEAVLKLKELGKPVFLGSLVDILGEKFSTSKEFIGLFGDQAIEPQLHYLPLKEDLREWLLIKVQRRLTQLWQVYFIKNKMGRSSYKKCFFKVDPESYCFIQLEEHNDNKKPKDDGDGWNKKALNFLKANINH